MTTATASHEQLSAGVDKTIAERRIIVAYGFWIFLLSDAVTFAALFATYAVLSGATAGGPTARDLFDLNNVFLQTMLLLFSSFTCALGAMAVEARRLWLTYLCALATFALGAAFLFMEFNEFSEMIAKDAGPQRSAFLSSFFTLVGAHGLHVAAGLVWLLILMMQLATIGFKPIVMRRLLCFSLFWHALDIIWIALFTTVYLMGVL